MQIARDRAAGNLPLAKELVYVSMKPAQYVYASGPCHSEEVEASFQLAPTVASRKFGQTTHGKTSRLWFELAHWPRLDFHTVRSPYALHAVL